MNTDSLNNLWNYLQGLPLTAENEKWLAKKLIEDSKLISESKEKCVFDNTYDKDRNNSEKHLSVLGIPIDGNINEFVIKLESKGCRRDLSKPYYVLKGPFSFEPYCKFLPWYTPITNTVCWVSIEFSKYGFESRKSLINEFIKSKEILTKKYGKPKFDFDSDIISLSNLDNIWDFLKNNHELGCDYLKNKGSISLRINYRSWEDTASIEINYRDKINYTLYKKERKRKEIEDM